MPKRAIKLSLDAIRQFKALGASERARLKLAMQASLAQDDATVENRNRFRLRRPSGQFEFEFRDGDLRVFYRVSESRVFIDAIGRKRGNQLLIENKKVTI